MPPYEVMFGVDPIVGLKSSNLLDYVIDTIKVENDVDKLTDTRREDKIAQEAIGIHRYVKMFFLICFRYEFLVSFSMSKYK
jgi:hypothetical protein